MLAQRLDIVLDTNQQLMRIVPDRHLNWRPPERNRTVRSLGYHVFRLSLAFVDGMDMGEFPESWLLDEAPDDLRDGPAIARYGALVRGRISGWFEGARCGMFIHFGHPSQHGWELSWPLVGGSRALPECQDVELAQVLGGVPRRALEQVVAGLRAVVHLDHPLELGR